VLAVVLAAVLQCTLSVASVTPTAGCCCAVSVQLLLLLLLLLLPQVSKYSEP
jgi:hypothetical protein